MKKYTRGYVCKACGLKHDTHESIVKHLNARRDEQHGNDKFKEELIKELEYNIEPILFESIYVINKSAKDQEERSVSAYYNDSGRKAKEHSERKKALYKIKETILENIQEYSKNVEKHEINDKDFYCLEFEDSKNREWSFHTPCETFDLRVECNGYERLSDFSKDSTVQGLDRSLRESLVYLKKEHNLDLNKNLRVDFKWVFL